MHQIVTRFLAALIKEHISDEKELSFQAGKASGCKSLQPRILQITKDAYVAEEESSRKISSLAADLEEAKRRENVWKIVDERGDRSIDYDPTLYGPKRLKVTPSMVQKMRDEVAQAVLAKLIKPPTEDQWAMILSDHPATCVVAGAGSGKSTTLVLRVVFMLCHLGIRPNGMTVVSFTVDSCKELRAKLHDALSFHCWNSEIHMPETLSLEVMCKTLVSTFHAALSRVAKQQFKGVLWFDVMKDDKSESEDDQDDDDIDNPVASASRLSERQKELLLTAYRDCFAQDATFRQHIVQMIKLECDRDILMEASEKEYQRFAIEKASGRDLELVRIINTHWETTGWTMPGIDPTPFIAFKAEGQNFYANGRIIATGMPIFLSLNGHIDNRSLFTDEETVGEGRDIFSTRKSLKVRRNIVNHFFGGSKLDLRTTHSIGRLKYRLEYLEKTDFEYVEAPRFEILLNGEISKSDILEAFYSQASFIENLGKEALTVLQELPPFKPNSIEYHFVAALCRFWRTFEATLASQIRPIMTFNRAFLLLGNEHIDHPLIIPPQALLPFENLLIDEFQDISPQIANWIKAMQQRLCASSPGKQPTIMAIGDDWQSIYGWRGSAPELFIDFGKHFPVNAQLAGHEECRMLENYRSVQPVIKDAEKLLRPVKIKIPKSAKPMRPTEDDDHGVKLITGVDLENDLAVVVAEIRVQLAFVNSLPTSDKRKVVVLSRSRKMVKAVKKLFGSAPGVFFYTYHGSKGLQGEVAILCDNCAYDAEHDLRNAVYKASKLFRQTYDESARDEAQRLAYVAVTRGIRRVVWLVGEPKGAAELLAVV